MQRREIGIGDRGMGFACVWCGMRVAPVYLLYALDA